MGGDGEVGANVAALASRDVPHGETDDNPCPAPLSAQVLSCCGGWASRMLC